MFGGLIEAPVCGISPQIHEAFGIHSRKVPFHNLSCGELLDVSQQNGSHMMH